MTLLEYRLAWSRNYLKNVGAVENSSRGVWAITELGRHLTTEQIHERVREWKAEYNRRYRSRRRRRQAKGETKPVEEVLEEPEEDQDAWKDQLSESVLELSPDGFERLAQRLLREAGFINVQVVGRSGDGGIDGVGVYRLSLVSFPVFFQCKRYRGTVSAGAVRDFRGAMAGRGEKGLLITTGTFTREARAEATRDGAPPVELIDGDDLFELLKQHRLGVRVMERVVEDVELVPTFFEEL